MNWLIGFELVCAALVAAAVWHWWSERRVERLFQKKLTRMNRGKMDRPGWVKQPWQHGSATDQDR